jgi:hypothetical protein
MEQSNCIFIYHHLGLGDHISCHGIVRHYCKIYGSVNLFVKECNYENIKFMYNDIKNLNLIIGNDDSVVKYIVDNNLKNIKYIGFNLNNFDNLEFQFYRMADVPIEYKRDKFFINRNIEKELKLFNDLKLEKSEYIFVHKGEFCIREEYINTGLKIVEPNSHGFFDWMYIIENAKEIHCMNSSFSCLIDNMKLDENIKLYNHRYIRKCPNWMNLYKGKKWIEIN